MLGPIVKHPFNQFDCKALDDGETEVLDGGIVKHISILKYVFFFIPFQIALALVAPEIIVVMTAVSFVSLMLGTAWYAISFQNVSASQLAAGVADFITKKMFRAFMLSFVTLIICALIFVVKMLLPEMKVPPMGEISLAIRLVILVTNVSWLLLVLVDVYHASVSYDAADSLLGDGFPTLMRGARANPPLVRLLVAVANKLGVDTEEIAEDLPDKDSES